MSENGVSIQGIQNSSIDANIIAGGNVIQITVQNTVPEPGNASEVPSLQFDCGHRLKIVRDALGLNPAQCITLLNYPSEKGWNDIEQRKQEVPDTLLTKIASLSGVSVQWLQTGEAPMVPVHYFSLRNTSGFWEELEAQNPTAVFLFLCDSYEDTRVVAQIGPYAYKVYTLDFGLNFWSWIEAHGYIPLVLELLWGILHRYELACDVVYLPKRTYQQFEDGILHPHIVLRQQKVFKYFPDDLFYNSGDEHAIKRYGRLFNQLATYLAKHFN